MARTSRGLISTRICTCSIFCTRSDSRTSSARRTPMPPTPPARPTPEAIDVILPPYDIDGMKISDGYYLRDITHAEIRERFHVARKGGAEIVAHRAYYDGGNGGLPGHYG